MHAITDGRDVSPHQAAGLLATLEAEWAAGAARFATVCGRIYAMDRDSRWERTEQYYRAVVDGVGARPTGPPQAVAAAYEAGVTDEFVEPVVVDRAGLIRAGDELVFFNFRPDRARQLCAALADPEFDRVRPRPVAAASDADHDDDYWTRRPATVAFPPEWPDAFLADVLEAAGDPAAARAPRPRSTRTSRTSSTAGRARAPRRGADPGAVADGRATYDQAPEMSAAELADRVCEAIDSGDVRLRVVNFANPDMVGHTGVIPAAIRAVEAADAGLGRVADAVQRAGRHRARHGRPRQRRGDADRRTGQPHDRPHDESGAAGDHRPGRAAPRRRRSE